MPSYNTGPRLARTAEEARAAWQPVWVVVDGSDDGSDEGLEDGPGFRVLRRARNGGKGAAVLDGLRAADAAGFSHVLVMDADGQHPAGEIARFMALSREHPEAMILGVPVFDASAPRVRVLGRRISNGLVRFETGQNIGDALFGFRVYPLRALRAVMEAGRHMRGYDFDTEALVRLCWRGVEVRNCAVPVRYFAKAEGGVSHFRYGRDNALLFAMHVRLIGEMVRRRF